MDETTIAKLNNLYRIQARIKAVQEECERLCREIEIINPIGQYYNDPDQAADFDQAFQDAGLPWLASTELDWLIGQLDMQRERERQEWIASLPAGDDGIPF